MFTSTDAKKKKKKAKQNQQRYLYALRPAAMTLPVLYLVALLVAHIIRGGAVDLGTVVDAGVFALLVTAICLVGTWVGWFLCRRSDWVANAVFSLAILGFSVWTIGMNGYQREEATTIVQGAIDGQVDTLKQSAHAAIDELP